ncbi:MAG: flagellar protein FlgN [Rhodospirillales bacterium]|nr:flagellar protein FlgN [Rhodospirillales bacterium]
MDASKRVGDLIAISRQLAELLTQENTALRDNQPDQVTALFDQKDELSRAYESRVSGLAEHVGAEEMKTIDLTLRDHLRILGREIQTLSAENAGLLQIAMEVNRRVLHGVADAVKASQPSAGTYSNTGTISHGARRVAPQNVPISLDKSF